MAVRYEMMSATTNMGFREGAGSQYPLIKTTTSPKIINGYVQKNTIMKGETLVSVGATDKWLNVTSIDGVSVNGYVAQIYNGVKYCTITEFPVVDPALKQAISYITIVPHYEDGTSGIAEDYYPQQA